MTEEQWEKLSPLVRAAFEAELRDRNAEEWLAAPQKFERRLRAIIETEFDFRLYDGR